MTSSAFLRLAVAVGALVGGAGIWLRWAPRFVQDEEVEVAAACALAITVCGGLAWRCRPLGASWPRWGLLPGAWAIGATVFVWSNIAAPSPRVELLGPILELIGGVCLLTGLLQIGCQRGLQPRIRPRPGPKSTVKSAEGRSRKASDLVAGDRLRLDSDVPVPVDVRVVSGRGFVECGAVDGHEAPIGVEPGAELMAGTVPKSGGLEAEVVADFGHSFQSRRAELLRQIVPELGALRPEDRASIWGLWLAAVACGLAVWTLSDEAWDRSLLTTGSAWLLLQPGLPFLCLVRGRLSALRSFLRHGVLGESSDAMLGLVRARRWLVDPMLVTQDGELEILAIGSVHPSEGARWAAALYQEVDGLERPALLKWLAAAELEAPSARELSEVDGVRRAKVDGHDVMAGRLDALKQIGLELPAAHGKALAFLQARQMLVIGVGTEGRGLQFLLGIKPLPVDDIVRACRLLDARLVPTLDRPAIDALAASSELPVAKKDARARDATLLRAQGPRPASGHRLRVLEGRLILGTAGRAPVVGRRILPDWAAHLLAARRQLGVQLALGWGTALACGLIACCLGYAGVLLPSVATAVSSLALALCGSDVELNPIRRSA